ncbi:hypothetical protein D918_03513, partial [Trichuris suis]
LLFLLSLRPLCVQSYPTNDYKQSLSDIDNNELYPGKVYRLWNMDLPTWFDREAYQPVQYNSMDRRSVGFFGSRGKKVPFFGARGKRLQMDNIPESYQGDGKNKKLDFFGVRG